jgi:hypothetical protein
VVTDSVPNRPEQTSGPLAVLGRRACAVRHACIPSTR